MKTEFKNHWNNGKRADLRNPGVSTGFTLIELLAVLAVLAILAAILIPLLSSVRDRVLAAKGLANMRQSASLLVTSAAENNNEIILVDEINGNNLSWYQMLARMGDRFDPGDAAVDPSYPPYQLENGFEIFGVPMNETLGPAIERTDGFQTRKVILSRVETPGNFVLLVDSVNPRREAQWRTAWDRGTPSGVHARHSGTMNIALADGSARRVTPEAYAELRAEMLDLDSVDLSYYDEALELRSVGN